MSTFSSERLSETAVGVQVLHFTIRFTELTIGKRHRWPEMAGANAQKVKTKKLHFECAFCFAKFYMLSIFHLYSTNLMN